MTLTGNYSNVAIVAQGLKRQWQKRDLYDEHREALDVIATQIAWVLHGNAMHIGCWVEIQQAAERAVRATEEIQRQAALDKRERQGS